MFCSKLNLINKEPSRPNNLNPLKDSFLCLFQITFNVYLKESSLDQQVVVGFADITVGVPASKFLTLKMHRGVVVLWFVWVDHDFCLSRSHYTDNDPTSRERAAIVGIEPRASSSGVARSTTIGDDGEN